MKKRRLENRTVVITGAAGGIGRELARQLSLENARLALIDLQKVEAGAGHKSYLCDLTLCADVEKVCSQIKKDFGRIDILINNAGITHRSYLRETSPEVIKKVIQVNLLGSVYMTMACLDEINKNDGLVAGMSSVAGFAPLLGRGGYCAAKHGLTGFLRTLRTEGTRTLLVHPAFIATQMDSNALAADGSPLERKKPLIGRALSPQRAVAQIIAAIKKNQSEIYPGPTAKLARVLFKCIPALYRWQMIRKTRSEFI